MNNIYKFTGKAETYAKYRPTYPQAYIDYLFKTVKLDRESVIAEIGSGTGILLKQLLDRHPCVIGVEPNDDMRGVAERNLAGYTGFISHVGTAENTLLERQSQRTGHTKRRNLQALLPGFSRIQRRKGFPESRSVRTLFPGWQV